MSLTINEYSSSSDEKYKFEPGENITALELAQLLPYLIAAWKNENEHDVRAGKLSLIGFNSIPKDFQQHFKRIELT